VGSSSLIIVLWATCQAIQAWKDDVVGGEYAFVDAGIQVAKLHPVVRDVVRLFLDSSSFSTMDFNND
jgi:hypothetical protein